MLDKSMYTNPNINNIFIVQDINNENIIDLRASEHLSCGRTSDMVGIEQSLHLDI